MQNAFEMASFIWTLVRFRFFKTIPLLETNLLGAIFDKKKKFMSIV
jgi:hypothetical protein